jgi:putative RNA 2'-phosphotransferase
MSSSRINLTRLSKTMSRVLRHAPWEFELELDDEGWTSFDHLLGGLRLIKAFAGVTRDDVLAMMQSAAKQRFEVDGERIRALYGHSVPGKLIKQRADPPAFLYHGTARRFVPAIRRDGLRPMRRQYVHLSVDTDMALSVGSRKGEDVVILRGRAAEAAAGGVPFYAGNPQVWLADAVPPEWIDMDEPTSRKDAIELTPE